MSDAGASSDNGAMPDSWRRVTLGDALVLQRGYDLPVQDREPGHVPIVSSGGITGTHSVAKVHGPGVVTGRYGTLGRVIYIEEDFWPLNTTLYVKDFKGNDPRFISYLLGTVDYVAHDDKSTVPGVNRNDLYRAYICLPALEQQRAIARVLATVQQAIQARRRELALERERKAALMQHLFTHGTLGEAPKQTEIGAIPESWKVVRLGQLISIANGQVDPKISPYRSMIHIGPEDVEEGTGRLLQQRTASDLSLISGKYLFSPNDVVYSKIRPYLRKVVQPDFAGICSADMYPLRPTSPDLSKGWLFHLLLSESFTAQAVGQQARTGIPKLNRQQLLSIAVPLPSPSEQGTITRVLFACDAKIEAMEHEVRTLTELFSALLEELMSGRLPALPLIDAGLVPL